jgi:hypothetical protein
MSGRRARVGGLGEAFTEDADRAPLAAKAAVLQRLAAQFSRTVPGTARHEAEDGDWSCPGTSTTERRPSDANWTDADMLSCSQERSARAAQARVESRR